MAFGLTAGRVDAGDLTPNDCLALDLAMSRMREKLAADAFLVSVFGASRITRWDSNPDWWGLKLPHLAVYPIAASPANNPGNVESNEAEVFVAVIRDGNDIKRTLADWEPGISSVSQRIRKVLTAGGLIVTVNGQQAQLGTGHPDAFSAFPVIDPGGVRELAVHETRWVLDLKVEIASGYPLSVDAALP